MNYKWPLINDNVSQKDREVLSDFILSNQASWITGQILHLDGGLSTLKL